MNRTLFDCGICKSVELKNGCLLDITPMMEKTAGLSTSSDVKCNCCGKTFKCQQYLEGHMKVKHPTAQNDTQEGSKNGSMLANLNEVDVRSSLLEDSPQDADIVQEAEAPIFIENRGSVANKRRGSTKPTQSNLKRKPWIFQILSNHQEISIT